MASIIASAGSNRENQRAMKAILKCKAAGMAYGAIARELNANGFVTARGKRFHRQTVKRLYLRGL